MEFREREREADGDEADGADAPSRAAAPETSRCRAPERDRGNDNGVTAEMTKMARPTTGVCHPMRPRRGRAYVEPQSAARETMATPR